MRFRRFLYPIASLSHVGAAAVRENPYAHLPPCKVAPSDSLWPTQQDWSSLNASIGNVLLSTSPAASSCYPGNPFGSTDQCSEVIDGWGYSAFHGSLPESVNYPIWANNSCLPPNATGYDESAGCHIGGYPQYIADVTTAEQVAVALRWAAERNVRVVVKGTGHDLNGRSAGAFSLSIWTHNLNQRSLDHSWPVPGSDQTASVLIAGSGNTWGDALGFALEHGRVVVSGQDKTVGLGGYIQGGGHGPLSSTYGLSADQLLQVTVVTSTGRILVANDAQNQDLFWAVRGGGGGQYGVVVEYVMLTYPPPVDIVVLNIAMSAADVTNNDPATANATWMAAAGFISSLPDLMDQGVTGSGGIFTGQSAQRNLGLSQPPPGNALNFNLWSYNSTPEAMTALLAPVRENVLRSLGNASSLISMTISEPTTTPNYTAFFDALNASPSVAGSVSLASSRLLGRSELSELPRADLASYLKRIMVSSIEAAGSYLVIGLQGGPGPRKVPVERRGSANPVWRKTYLHFLVTGANVDLDGKSPGQVLSEGAEWMETNKEGVWREWGPETGAYMNEGNPFDGQWQHDFYGISYERLVQIKREYDPTYTLSVQSGVDSDFWTYSLDTGLLCQTQN
ncbi:putative isoamyl alcohol [Rosellinia necatrix]|uniref:Putative isoamyl alcohol n=1 Tax=Rosellinia necatrix TaxID=77044 RepID=A0A1W2TTC3_ROSNE|nr:putative isoamyl alcohol [Rosellinia necatrix]